MSKPRNIDLSREELEDYIVGRAQLIDSLVRESDDDDEGMRLAIADLYESGLKRYGPVLIEKARVKVIATRETSTDELSTEKRYLRVAAAIVVGEVSTGSVDDLESRIFFIASIFECGCRLYGVFAMAAAREKIWQREEWLRAGRCGGCGAEMPDWEFEDEQVATLCDRCIAVMVGKNLKPPTKLQ